MKLIRSITAAIVVSALMITITACEKDGPVENAGEKVDEGVEKTGEAAKDAADEVKEATDGD